MENKKKSNIYILAMTAIMAAVTCVLAPLSIPIGPVPVSLTILSIYLALYLLGWKLGTVSFVVYLLLGLVGLPVFSGFSGGLGKLAGPTGGYIIGFLPMAIVAGLFIDRFRNRGLQFVGMVLGVVICYAFGTAWFCISTGSTLAAALGLCVLPFLPFDLAKIVIVLILGPILRARLVKAGLLRVKQAETAAA